MKITQGSQHSFAVVPNAEIPRSSFDRSHGYKTTFDASFLIPIFLDEALPGDTFNLKMTGFAWMATPIFPIMDNLYMDTFFFAVPHRLIWDNWERFCGAQTNPGDSTDYLIPQVVAPVGGYAVGTLADYFGVPPLIPDLSTSALPWRAYVLIHNEWFRDQNMAASVTVPTGDGPDSNTIMNFTPFRRYKRHDYFTSCLPFPQKGDSVDIPLGTTAPVIGTGSALGLEDATPQTRTLIGTAASTAVTLNAAPLNTGPLRLHTSAASSGVIADLSTATAATINQLRQAFQIQKMLERDARGGTRYTEVVRAHFGVTSPDARLQRPEYLGGGSSPVNISAVAQTSESNTTPQGNLSAFGTATLQGHGFTKSFTEHCIIIGMVMVRADLTYQQSLNRMWSRQTRFDYYWPALAHIGEQAVLNKEIHAVGNATDEDVFGYQERFAEYRYKPSMITGQFRSIHPQSLDAWHLAQEFTATPVLNSTFMAENVPVDRVIATPSEPHFLFDSHFSLRCARPMPLFGVPGLIDHF